MKLEQLIPTINEIAINAADRDRDRLQSTPTAFRPNRFRVNQRVAFFFMGRHLTGRISNAMCRGGVCSYHIETPGGGWFREIDESQVMAISK